MVEIFHCQLFQQAGITDDKQRLPRIEHAENSETKINALKAFEKLFLKSTNSLFAGKLIVNFGYEFRAGVLTRIKFKCIPEWNHWLHVAHSATFFFKVLVVGGEPFANKIEK